MRHVYLPDLKEPWKARSRGLRAFARSRAVPPMVGGAQPPRTLRSTAVRSRRNDPLPRSACSVNPIGPSCEPFRRGFRRRDRRSKSWAVGSRSVVFIRASLDRGAAHGLFGSGPSDVLASSLSLSPCPTTGGVQSELARCIGRAKQQVGVGPSVEKTSIATSATSARSRAPASRCRRTRITPDAGWLVEGRQRGLDPLFDRRDPRREVDESPVDDRWPLGVAPVAIAQLNPVGIGAATPT